MKKLSIVFIIIGILLVVAAGVFAVYFVTGTNSSPSVSSSSDSGSTSTVASVDSSSSDPLVGSWSGSKSLFFGMAEATFTLKARQDGTMTINGIANAPVAGIENEPFSQDATWTHLSGTTYVGSIGDSSLEFTCDGNTIYLTVNPYAAGLIDNEMLNMDLELTLTRQ